MKTIIITFAILHFSYAISMERRKSQSPARMNTLLARNRSQSSLSDRIQTKLYIAPDASTPTVDALITGRRSQQPTAKPSAEQMDMKEPSRNLKMRAAENNRNNFTKMILSAYDAIRNIRTKNDTAYKQYESNLKYARYYYTTWIALEVQGDSSILSGMADEELKPVQDTFNKKMASLPN